MKIEKLIELSHRMTPGEEEFELGIETMNVEEVHKTTVRRSGIWYIIQRITMSSHVGTHIEFPYHHLESGKSAAEYPLERLVGDAVLFNFTHKKKDEVITLEEIKNCGVDVKKGDIAIIYTGMQDLWKTPLAHDRPVLSVEATRYLVIDKGIHAIGTDATGLEVRGTDFQPVHQLLFDNDVAMIESMTNLDKLSGKRFSIIILPLMIEGMDACPVRIVASEN
ncbi:MAG: cyclase family protein [Chitinophagaceae bacterium]|nr:cyclase family protein [Chitinophagaceae bacterium]